ncbi:MAG: hypothetical protein L6R39_001570 [Caloplaca ligustica]|nr:MAG: hypothetical protein L6R39_001570 [Caloplaca ligustica]
MPSSSNLEMGSFEDDNRASFRIRAGKSDCMFRRLEVTSSEEVQERVSTVASLLDIDTKTTETKATIAETSLLDAEAADRITSIAPGIAEDLGFKDDIKADVPFRLIRRDNQFSDFTFPNRVPSFITLSYCWHDPTWVLDRHSAGSFTAAANFSWPISRYMVKALLLERTSLDEGIWIDQCCINQNDPQEKSRTISCMDLIYQRARVVVVVLEDVTVNEAEGVVLENLMHECSNQGSAEFSVRESSEAHHIVRLALRIFSARWFTRAWCNHELLVSKHHMFLINVAMIGPDHPRVLRFTLPFLESLVQVCTSYDYFGVRDIHHSTLMAQLWKLGKRGLLHILFDPFRVGQGCKLSLINDGPLTPRRLKSPLETYMNISKFGAKVAADKVAITLNIVGSRLYYKGPDRSELDYGLLVSVLSLVSGDPAVLCCSGDKYKLPEHTLKSSWVQRPASNSDFAGIARRDKTHRPLDYVPSFTLEQIELDMFYVGSNTETSIRRASAPFLKQAQWYIDGCIELSKDDAVSQLGGTLAQGRATKIQLLACALECGAAWIDEAASAKTAADYPDPDLRGAIQIFFPNHDTKDSVRAIAERYRDEYEALVDFIETLTLNYVSPMDIPGWAPVVISTGPAAADRVLSMCPVEAAQQFTAMIPTLLLDNEYMDCRRMFWLEGIPHKPAHWRILGKSSIFGVGLDVLTPPQDPRLRTQQVIEA